MYAANKLAEAAETAGLDRFLECVKALGLLETGTAEVGELAVDFFATVFDGDFFAGFTTATFFVAIGTVSSGTGGGDFWYQK